MTPMLKTLRDNLKSLSWILILVVAVFVISVFADYGGRGSWTGGGGRQWAARVDGEVIPATEFLASARSVDAYYRSLLGEAYERQRGNLNVGQQAIQQLVQEQLIIAHARELGLSVTPEEVRDAIVNDPSLQGPNGFVGADRYKSLLRQRGLDPGSYEGDIERSLLRRKWIEVVTAGVLVSDGEVEREVRRRNESADISYALFRPQDFTAQVTLSDADLERHWAAHQDDYRQGEGRRVEYVLFDRLREQRNIQVPEEEARAEYEGALRQRFTLPEQRRASHILIKTAEGADDAAYAAARARAEAALARVRGGESFVQVAREVSEDSSASAGGDLGYFGRGVMALPFEQAVWALEKVGDLSGIVQTQFGFHIIQLGGIQTARQKPFEEVRDEIRSDLAFRKSGEIVESQARAFAEAVRATPESFRDEAGRRSLVVGSPVVLHPGAPLPGLGASPELERTILALAPGATSDAIATPRGHLVAHFIETVPGGVQPLAAVTDRVRDDLRAQRTREMAGRLARQAVSDPKHRPLADLATPLGFTVQEAPSVSRGLPIGAVGVSPELEAAVFTAPLNALTGPVETKAGPVVFEVRSRREMSDADLASQTEPTREQLLADQRQKLATAVLQSLAEGATVEYNTELLARVQSPASQTPAATP